MKERATIPRWRAWRGSSMLMNEPKNSSASAGMSGIDTAPLPEQKSSGRLLISMSSVAGRLGYAYRTPYASSKWALVGLTKSLAIELGPHGVRANAILPGTVEGERMSAGIVARAAATGTSVEATRDEYLQKISLRRMVTARDVAAMTLFLASPAARNVTGQAISVDGNVEYL